MFQTSFFWGGGNAINDPEIFRSARGFSESGRDNDNNNNNNNNNNEKTARPTQARLLLGDFAPAIPYHSKEERRLKEILKANSLDNHVENTNIANPDTLSFTDKGNLEAQARETAYNLVWGPNGQVEWEYKNLEDLFSKDMSIKDQNGKINPDKLMIYVMEFARDYFSYRLSTTPRAEAQDLGCFFFGSSSKPDEKKEVHTAMGFVEHLVRDRYLSLSYDYDDCLFALEKIAKDFPALDEVSTIISYNMQAREEEIKARLKLSDSI